MPIIDFTEIPEAHIATGKQDSFELFCQEFLKFCGLEIISSPDRGADGGKDLLCLEKRKGGFGVTEIIWLVSCKHKAHSKSSITPSDEENISDRVRQHKADGFIGFYSSVLSASLNERLNQFKNDFEVRIFNNEDIEEKLLDSPKGKFLFKRFFPNSYLKWNNGKIAPANIFSEYEPLSCSYCGKDILKHTEEERYSSILGFVRDYEFSKGNNYQIDNFVNLYFACKGNCDDKLDERYSKQGYMTDWKDIGDLIIPVEYIRWYMALINNLYEGTVVFEKIAFEKIKKALMSIAQYVMRDANDIEKDRLSSLDQLPEWLR